MSKVILYDAVSTVNSIWSVLHISKTSSMDLFLVSLRNRIRFDAYYLATVVQLCRDSFSISEQHIL